MKLFDSIKNIIFIPDEDEFEDENIVAQAEKPEPAKKAERNDYYQTKRVESSPRIVGGGKAKSVTLNSQMQVVLVKPDRYDDVTTIADHLNEKKTVVLNLESADKDLARRIVDFLSGATYANHGNMRKVSRGTFLIVPNGVDMMGEVIPEEYEENMYF